MEVVYDFVREKMPRFAGKSWLRPCRHLLVVAWLLLSRSLLPLTSRPGRSLQDPPPPPPPVTLRVKGVRAWGPHSTL